MGYDCKWAHTVDSEWESEISQKDETNIYLLAMRIGAVILLGFRLSLDDWIACFEMRRISDDWQTYHAIGRTINALHRRAKVVFDVSTTFIRRPQLGVELAEDVLEGFATYVRQHVQSTSGADAGTTCRYALLRFL